MRYPSSGITPKFAATKYVISRLQADPILATLFFVLDDVTRPDPPQALRSPGHNAGAFSSQRLAKLYWLARLPFRNCTNWLLIR